MNIRKTQIIAEDLSINAFVLLNNAFDLTIIGVDLSFLHTSIPFTTHLITFCNASAYVLALGFLFLSADVIPVDHVLCFLNHLL